MGNRFASGKNSIAMCDRCGQQFKLTALKKEVIKTKIYNLLVCPTCWDPDQPQSKTFGQEQTFNFLALEHYHE